MIITVTPNPALDLTWHVERIVPGGTHRADEGVARAGGKGLNVARVAHANGSRVLAVSTTGGATGAEFASELDASGVPHELIAVQGATRRSVALVDEQLGDTTIVNERGANPTIAEWQALREAVRRSLGANSVVAEAGVSSRSDSVGARSTTPGEDPVGAHVATTGKDPDSVGARVATGQDDAQHPVTPVLVISGSLPPGAPDGLLASLIGIGRDAGATVIVDTSGPALLAAAEAGAHVLKPNAAELAQATGIADPLTGACALLDRGAELILLSLGADGMLAITPDVIVRARLAAPLAGNPTGAGDAAVAACAVLLAAGETDAEAILRRATAWSAAAVLMPLAGEIHPSWPDLESALIVDHPPLTALTSTAVEKDSP